MQFLAGAAIFAAGAFFGAWLIAAGMQMQKNRGSQKFQDAILKTLEKSTDGQKGSTLK